MGGGSDGPTGIQVNKKINGITNSKITIGRPVTAWTMHEVCMICNQHIDTAPDNMEAAFIDKIHRGWVHRTCYKK